MTLTIERAQASKQYTHIKSFLSHLYSCHHILANILVLIREILFYCIFIFLCDHKFSATS